MKTRFQNEKQAREETIGRAATMAAAAVRENRELTVSEIRKVDALLTAAELLGLGTSIPRGPRDLLTYLEPKKPRRSRS